MESLIIAMGIASVTMAIAYQIAKLVNEQKKLKRDIKRMEDFNIEYRNIGGSGISKQRKNYGQMEDDWRHEVGPIEPTQSELRDNVDRKERHSISGHSNDPSEQQKYAFKKEQE